jgi:hypothetical protein
VLSYRLSGHEMTRKQKSQDATNGKNEDGLVITQDVDVLVLWRVVGQARFPRISVMSRQFLAIPAASATEKPACV